MQVKSRETAAAEALGSTRAEGLEPSQAVLDLVDQWKRGEISDEQLDAAKRRIIDANTVHPIAAAR